MNFFENRWALVALVTICWGVIATFSTGYYYHQYTDLIEKLGTAPIDVTVTVDFGNEEVRSFDDVRLYQNSNATAFDALLAVAIVDTTYYPSLGTLVTSVNGTSNEPWPGKGWQYWVNGEYGLVAPDKKTLVNGDQVEWNYTTYEGHT